MIVRSIRNDDIVRASKVQNASQKDLRSGFAKQICLLGFEAEERQAKKVNWFYSLSTLDGISAIRGDNGEQDKDEQQGYKRPETQQLFN